MNAASRKLCFNVLTFAAVTIGAAGSAGAEYLRPDVLRFHGERLGRFEQPMHSAERFGWRREFGREEFRRSFDRFDRFRYGVPGLKR